MDKEKQIEEMEITKIALSICKEKAHCINLWGEENLKCVNHPYCETAQTVKALYAADYRKADEVIDEFIERLKEEDEISRRRYGKGIGMYDIHRIADKMKFELFKQREVEE